MSEQLLEFLEIDAPALLTGTLAAITCGLLGNLLVLRRQSLVGDAISHAVLPGLVLAFLVTGTRDRWPMFIGAAAAGGATVVLTTIVRRFGRLESGAATGVVFSILFALGVVLMERVGARGVDLDADCVLHGQLEYVFWLMPASASEMLTLDGLRTLPRELTTLAIVTVVVIALLGVFGKELKLCAFDPAFATSLGFRAGLVNLAYLLLVATAVVASFEAVGSILVVAMLVCPAATARHLTDRYRTQLILSVVIAASTGVIGYVLAAGAPVWLGTEGSLGAAGMMAVVGGTLLVASILLAPRHGVIARAIGRFRLAVSVAEEDVLGMVYRAREADSASVGVTRDAILETLGGGLVLRTAVHAAERGGWLERSGDAVRLTQGGQTRARVLVRTHRLWESYLVEKLGLRPDHVHRAAMQLEHVTDDEMRAALEREAAAERDPHDRVIPES